MKFERSSGILLHPTSLPGEYGIGDLGMQAYQWIDFLSSARFALWQLLPLGPTGYGDSPYQCFSAFAGNPYLISPQVLLEADAHHGVSLLDPNDLIDHPHFPAERIDYGRVIEWKLGVLDRSYNRFEKLAPPKLIDELESFKQAQATWLDDYTLFMALKEAHGGKPWTFWQNDLRDRERKALENARRELDIAIRRQIFRQFIFFRQWSALRNYATSAGIKIIGDIPIFIAHDSSDVWTHPELFYLDETGIPSVVAGVPPDYFSTTGQLWGNPLYRWDVHKENGYLWWINRLRAVLETVDIVRLDHFRGFAGYWEVPGDAKTAEKGRWVSGPGENFFHIIRNALGELPIIAEDLGVITPDVVEMREKFNLPGMKILQFAFINDPKDPFLPHNYPQHCVVYTGTHDNDTALGWYERVDEEEKGFYRRYLNCEGSNVSWDLIRAVWSSVAVYGLAPLQDFLGLDNNARLNYPGKASGNWTWRMSPDALTDELVQRIKEINYLYDRENPVQALKVLEQVPDSFEATN
jgi:4-alpha-glucanotransferase